MASSTTGGRCDSIVRVLVVGPGDTGENSKVEFASVMRVVRVFPLHMAVAVARRLVASCSESELPRAVAACLRALAARPLSEAAAREAACELDTRMRRLIITDLLKLFSVHAACPQSELCRTLSRLGYYADLVEVDAYAVQPPGSGEPAAWRELIERGVAGVVRPHTQPTAWARKFVLNEHVLAQVSVQSGRATRAPWEQVLLWINENFGSMRALLRKHGYTGLLERVSHLELSAFFVAPDADDWAGVDMSTVGVDRYSSAQLENTDLVFMALPSMAQTCFVDRAV